MDFSFSDEERMIQKEVKKFCEKEIAPFARQVDKREKSPYEHFDKLVQNGFFGAEFPEKYGGQGTSHFIASIILFELSKACPATALAAGSSTLLCAGAIHRNGTEGQKSRYLPSLLHAEKIGAWGVTEPNAGSDFAAMQSTAVRDGKDYILNGSKTFITNAPEADIFVIYAATKKDGGHDGISAFILERGMQGLTTGKPLEKLGFRGCPTGEIFMSDVRVPGGNLLGQEHMGFRDALATLNNERANAPIMAAGMIEKCLETCIKYAMERKQFGKPIAMQQAIQFKLARMYTLLEHVKTMGWRITWMRQHDMNFAKEAAAAKYFCAEAAFESANEAIQIHGGYGFMEEYEMERLLRDAKLLAIGGGTSEIQQLLLAGLLMDAS